MSNHDFATFEAAARAVGWGFDTYPALELYPYDLGATALARALLPRPTPFAAETPPVRERIAESRTMKGAAAWPGRHDRRAGVEFAEGHCHVHGGQGRASMQSTFTRRQSRAKWQTPETGVHQGGDQVALDR